MTTRKSTAAVPYVEQVDTTYLEGLIGYNARRAALIESLLHGLAHLSLPAVHRLGRALGELLACLPNPPRRLAARNLELCLPELGAAERARHERRVLYVGLTRAMRGLMLMSPQGCRHPAIVDLDLNHWHVESAP